MKKKVLLGIFLALISVGILTSCGTEKEKEKEAQKDRKEDAQPAFF